MTRNPKPITVVVDDTELPTFSDWLQKGHTVLTVAQYAELPSQEKAEVDAFIHPNAFPLRKDDRYVSREKQKELIEKAIRAQKYPPSTTPRRKV